MFETNKRYSFSTISNLTLDSNYKNLKCLIPDTIFDIAITFRDVITIRENLIQETGLSLMDPKTVHYAVFEGNNGDKIVLAYDWIVLDSILLVENIDLNIIVNNISTEDTIIIKNVLNRLGYTNLIITETSNREV